MSGGPGAGSGPDLATLTEVCKPEIFSRTLEGGVAALFFDGRADGVQLPAQLRGQAQVILNFSWRYNLADFTFDGFQARGSLSFGGVPSLCVVPWSAVWGIANDARSDAWFWIASMPSAIQRSFGVAALGDIAAMLVAHQHETSMDWCRAGDDSKWSAGPVASATPAPSPKIRPAWLREVSAADAETGAETGADGGTEAEGGTTTPADAGHGPDAPDGPAPEPPPSGRPMLRRIK